MSEEKVHDDNVDDLSPSTSCVSCCHPMFEGRDFHWLVVTLRDTVAVGLVTAIAFIVRALASTSNFQSVPVFNWMFLACEAFFAYKVRLEVCGPLLQESELRYCFRRPF